MAKVAKRSTEVTRDCLQCRQKLRVRLESEFERHVKNLANSSSLDDRDVNNLEKVSSVD